MKTGSGFITIIIYSANGGTPTPPPPGEFIRITDLSEERITDDLSTRITD